jgi:CMP-N,N'-diacetyllegionaminic acid synthase
MSNILFLIPARAGSKGLPQKNIKNLAGKPLIAYSIEFALQHAQKDDIICISTNDLEVIEIVKKQFALEVPFIRPEELSNDTASTFEVIIHALDFYKQKGLSFEKIMLLQPTSPYRTKKDFEQINELYNKNNVDMVVSVKKSKESPYFTLFQEDNSGCLKKIISNSNFLTRQECPPIYVFNGSMYLVNTQKFLEFKNFNFENIIKYEMPESRSVDIDTKVDWVLAEYYQNTYNENS